MNPHIHTNTHCNMEHVHTWFVTSYISVIFSPFWKWDSKCVHIAINTLITFVRVCTGSLQSCIYLNCKCVKEFSVATLFQTPALI